MKIYYKHKTIMCIIVNKCKREHDLKNCPAFGKSCNLCKKFHHFSVVCKNNKDVQQITDVTEYTKDSGINGDFRINTIIIKVMFCIEKVW